MILDYVLGGGLAAVLLVYLVVALARPDSEVRAMTFNGWVQIALFCVVDPVC